MVGTTRSPEASPVTSLQKRTTWDWPRVIFGIGILLLEGFWVHRTKVWIFVPFGGVAKLQSLASWLFAFLVFSFSAVLPRWRSLQENHSNQAATVSALTDARAGLLRSLPLAAHFLCFAIFAAVTLALSRTDELGRAIFLTILWFLLSAVTVVALGAATLPARFLALWNLQALLSGFAATVGSLALFRLFQTFWVDGSAFTISGVQLVLRQLGFSVTTAGKIVGTDRYRVEILSYCSGYEGIGLFLVFSIAWLVWFRKEYRFPAALVLVPVGVAVSLGLNVLRISSLILIGHFGYPKIAIGGFHSQAGWIAFTMLAVGFCAISYRIPGIRAAGAMAPTQRVQADDPAATYLGPFVAIQAAAMISMALSGGFEWLYPLRVLAPAAVLLWYRKDYARILVRPRLPVYAAGIGIVVSALWAGVAWHSAFTPGASAQLHNLAAPWRAVWWFFRFSGAVVLAPVVEELAFRGYLMRRVQGPEVEKVDPRRAGWLGLGLSSLAFGLLHGGRWMEGVAAGLLYGHAYARRGRLGDAVLAHAVTNLILMTAVFWTGDWRWW